MKKGENLGESVRDIPLRSWKAGRFLAVSLLLTVRSIVTRGSRVSRALPHHTLPAFLSLHGRIFCWKT